MSNKVYHAILTNGHQILTQVGRSTKTAVEIKGPFQIEDVSNEQTGTGNIVLTQYLFSEKQVAMFPKTSIVTMVEVDKPMTDYYHSYKGFNDKIIVKNRESDINKVTAGIQKMMDESASLPELIIFTNDIDLKQVYVPTSNTLN